jgi:catechol 2,3-dioxygenase
MTTETIAPATSIGGIQLTVADLDRSVQFYQDRLGFKLLGRENGQARLGTAAHALLTLIEKPGAKPRTQRGMTGLYHFAILLPDRRSLARLLLHMAENETEVQGAADHGVSEALYLADPDGNGIELYRDRQRNEWPVDDLGKLQMGTEELDVDNLVMELKDGVAPWTGLPDSTVIGHVHLHVRDLPEAEQFYTRVLGFRVMQRYGSGAIFVSAGGYHHHIGMNTWAGAGAPPPPPDVAGLRWFEVRLPDAAAFEALQARLKEANIPADDLEGGILIKDPSQNGILFRL